MKSGWSTVALPSSWGFSRLATKHNHLNLWSRIHRQLLQPISATERNRRRELILNRLLLGMIGLVSCVSLLATVSLVAHSLDYDGLSLPFLLIIDLALIAMFTLGRAGYIRSVAYLFVSVLFLFATYPILTWGILLPQAMLSYALLIVISGVLLSGRAAFRVAVLMSVLLVVITNLEQNRLIPFSTVWMKRTGSYSDVVIDGVTFMVIALVSWLSNHEIEGSLKRARQSEKALRRERNSLEKKVRERTKQLEQAHIAQMLELQRFAEFGRFSSALLHELANPLMAVSLNLEQLEYNQELSLVQQAREGITHMERYVEAARRQLRNQSEIKLFDVAEEVERVINLLDAMAQQRRVSLITEFDGPLSLLGDSIRFNQVVANLVANAIDAYSGLEVDSRIVRITATEQINTLVLSVIDYGMGITAGQRKSIFEPFFTTKSSKRGTGLGLTITKQIVEADFGGTITVTSHPREGTCFGLKLPLPPNDLTTTQINS